MIFFGVLAEEVVAVTDYYLLQSSRCFWILQKQRQNKDRPAAFISNLSNGMKRPCVCDIVTNVFDFLNRLMLPL